MKKIIKSICFSLLAFMFAIGSIFLPVGKQSQKYASADNTSYENIVFNSSNIIVARVGNRNYTLQNYSTNFADYLYNPSTASVNDYRYYLNFSFRLVRDGRVTGSLGEFKLNTYVNAFLNQTTGLVSTDGNNPYTNYVDMNFSVDNSLSIFKPSANSSSREVKTVLRSVGYRAGTDYSYRTLLGFTCISPTYEDNPDLLPGSLVIQTIEISNFVDFSNYVFDLTPYYSGTNMNVVCYTDSVGYKYCFVIPTWSAYDGSADALSSYFDYRRYYTSNAFDFSNNGYYQQGLEVGNAQGYDKGYNTGYRDGSSVGYEDGFENGKIEGAIESNNYSFFGLISAVIDAPVKILTSLFNFNFLGVNLWAFFTSILTISLIIFVIRKFMAKG